MPSSLRDLALSIISSNPSIASNPNAREMIDVIRSGDAERGRTIADNLCRTYGVDRDQAVRNARSFFNL